jgi:ferredoxin-NADP reductase
MRLSDFKGLFKTAVLEVMEIDNPHTDYYTVKMSYPERMTWAAGEHGIFTIPTAKIKGSKWRAFSVASSPEEGFLLIGMRTGDKVSSFKDVLLHLKKGDKIKIRGPFGWFKLQKQEKPLVLIAGGVGITPIRALLANIKDKDITAQVIYSSNNYYLFDNEIENIVNSNENISLHKTSNREETTEKINNSVIEYNNDAYYYVSGSVSFITSIKRNLKNSGIKSKNIISDPFIGY